MHPDPRFRWHDAAAMLGFVAEHAVAQICVVTEGGPALAHAPLSLAEDGTLRFHLAAHNRIVPHLDGAPIAASVIANDHYVSPDWYANPRDQVPTWNYCAVEIYGRARRLDRDGVRDQIDALSAAQEARLAPKPAWTSDKVAPDRLGRMIDAIVGFAIEDARLVGTRKLGQNKTAADRAGVIAALHARGRNQEAEAVAMVEGA